jgi:zinc transporter ZupT
MVPLSLIIALGLAALHIWANKLQFSLAVPRSKWLSFAGGSAVAYIFLHLLPELQEWQEAVQEKHEDRLGFLEHPLYLVSLLGLTVFYGLERMMKVHQDNRGKEESDTEIFWLHIASFSLYNGLIGYLLRQQEYENVGGLLLFALAMGFHFFVNDAGLLSHHKEDYQHKGRWVVSVAVLAGWALSLVIGFSEAGVGFLFAFLAGGVVLNVLKEELPEDRKSNFWAFLSGVIFYAGLLLWEAALV